MPESRRVIWEKSRVVRRRWQRSKHVFTFTKSQIERIDREEDREDRAKKLREKEKRRIANKKKKAEKEAEIREERRKHGLTAPNAPAVRTSQPLLSRFLTRPNKAAARDKEAEQEDSGDDFGSFDIDNESFDIEFEEIMTPKQSEELRQTEYARDDDDFPGCSIFQDEDILKEADALVLFLHDGNKENLTPNKTLSHRPKPTPAVLHALQSLFYDETAQLLEEMLHNDDDSYGTDEEFEQELLKLGEAGES